MASIDERALLPTERPSTSPPDAGIHLNVRASQFGGTQAEATRQFGSEALTAGQHWGQIAADDVSTQYETSVRKLLYGDPTKTVTKPDGTTGQDTGYFGLQGKLALDARPVIEKQLDQITKDARSKLLSFDQQKTFDGITRRYRNIQSTKVGQYADGQANVYAQGVNTATIKEQVEGIATNPNDDEMFKHHTANMVDAATKTAQLKGAVPGDAMWNSAQNAARAAAAETRIRAIGANDPMRGLEMADKYKADLGSHYDNVVDHLRARGEQQQGRQVADGILTGAAPPAGDDAKAVLRHFEGFISNPKMDTDGRLRVGYGSDTVTKADGSVVPVTSGSVVTREDAERDLERRAAISQQAIRQKVGGEAFDRLSPQAKASLISIAYNYGEGNIPQTVVDAAKTGYPAAIATAIRGLSGHNNGINRSRRAQEANNIVAGGAPEPSTQADQIAEVQAKNLPPQAEAAAIARINKSHVLQQATETKRKAEFKQRVDDGLAEAFNTGQPPSNPMTEGDFTKHLGPDDGAAKYAEYQSNIIYGIDRKSFDTMSDVEQSQFINARAPQLGARGYAHAVNRQAQLEKDAAQIQKNRREDPAGSVAQNGAVQGALARYDEKVPESFKPVADARLAAQERLGIDPEFRSPITKAEALKLTAPLRTMLPGDESKVLQQMGTKFQKMFGDQADEAFSYAIRAHKVDAEVAQQAANIVRKLRDGVPLVPSAVAPMDDAKERAAADRAVRGFAPPTAPGRAPLRTVDNPAEAESPPVPKPPNVPPAAIEFLLKNPGSDAAFDKKYGPGRAKALREKFPVAQGLP